MTVVAGDLDDSELLLEAAAGDAAAVRRLLGEVGPTLYGFIFARVGGDRVAAEDVMQDTFLEVVRSARTYRGEAALTTWMCTIARRRVARHWEAERRAAHPAPEVDGVARDELPDGDADAAFAALHDRDVIIRALGRLPAEHRHVLVLKYLDGEPVAAIASHLGRTPVAVQSLLQRARVGLRSALEEEAR